MSEFSESEAYSWFVLETQTMRAWLAAVMVIGCGESDRSAPDSMPAPVCGNGVAEADEQCDDGNPRNHDGCSPACVAETLVWTHAEPAGDLPEVRLTPAIAFDDARGRVVLFGGEGQGPFLDDTWEWDGAMWSHRAPTTVPPPRRGNALAYDAARGTVVMFGGTNMTGVLADTWEWNGTDWSPTSPATPPPARFYSSMAYDAARGKVVLFGGIGDQNVGILGDTWEWDGAEWMQLTPQTPPPPTTGHSLVYDAARSKLVLFAGGGTNDTWEKDGETWTLRSPTTRPPARGNHAGAYFADIGKVVVVGGSAAGGTPLGDTWAWDGTDWVELEPAAPPPGRAVFGLAYDAARQQVVLFGGGSNQGFLNETWLLRLE